MKKRRNWLVILVAALVVIVCIGIAAVIATTAWVQQNLSIQESTDTAAQDEFERVRTRFSGQPSVLELKDERTPSYNPARQKLTTPVSLERLHILVWAPDERRLLSFSIEFGAYTSGLDDNRVNLRPEDIEQYGPGIVLDTTSRDGERVLLWTE
jgi:type II secretory pathway pseudopilin PulG